MRNPIQTAKVFLLLAKITRDLNRLNDVIGITESLKKAASERDLQAIVTDAKSHAIGREAIEARTRLGVLDIETLCQLPAETLGGAYGRFMKTRGLKPESLPSQTATSDYDYVLAHYYETHDLWHVVTGFDTDPAGEVGLQTFYLAQTRSYLPFFIISAVLFNTALYHYEEKTRRLDAIAQGWQIGKKAHPFFGIDWRKLLDQSLTDIRTQLGVQTV